MNKVQGRGRRETYRLKGTEEKDHPKLRVDLVCILTCQSTKKQTNKQVHKDNQGNLNPDCKIGNKELLLNF